jgi:hypothetical protein
MYAAQCLWDVVMARSILAELGDDETMVVIVGSGHVAYGLGISHRIREERAAAGLPPVDVATFCPVTAPPPPDPNDDPAGHPMGGGHGMGGAVPSPARFTRSLADFVGAFPDSGGVEAYPQIGLQLSEEDGRVTVSMAWPDTPAEDAGFASGDVIVDVNGYRPPGLSELRTRLASIEWGQRLGFLVEREGAREEIGVLLYPEIDLTEPATAPGWAVQPAADLVDPAGASPILLEAVTPAPRWLLVSRDGSPQWVEVRSGELLEEAHDLDEAGRVERSLYRVARPDGAVEVRYSRSDDGSVAKVVRLDRTGERIAP